MSNEKDNQEGQITSEVTKQTLAAIAGASGGAQGGGIEVAGDGDFAEIRRYIYEVNDLIDLAFDTLEADLFRARVEAKQSFVEHVFPVARKARGARAKREQKLLGK